MRFAFSNAPHNYVASPDNMVMYTRSTAPGASDGAAVGQLWLDTSTNPGTIKECTSLGPVTWTAVSGSGSLTLTGDVTGTGSGSISTTTVKINGVTLGTTTATSGNVLIGSGTQWVTNAISGDAALASNGAITVTKTNGSSFATSATIDTTNAANISSGTLPAGRLPNPSASTLGGIESYASVSHQWINSISTSGVPSSSQPADSDLSFTDITTNNSSTSNHGFLKKLDNTATHYMDGTGAWSTPAGSFVSPLTTKGDVHCYTSTDARLAVGTDGQALLANSANSTGLGYDFPVLDLTRSFLNFVDFTKNSATAENTPLVTSSGTGAGTSFNEVFSTDGNNLGVVICSTGTTTTGYAGVFLAGFYANNGQLILSTNVYLDALSNGTDTFTINAGLMGSETAVGASNGIYMSYTNGTNSGNWVCVCNNGSSSTSNTSTAVVATTWTNVTIIVNAGATSVGFYINHTLVGTITNNIPTGVSFSGSGSIIVKSAGTTNVNLRNDFISIRKDFSNRR